MEPRQHEAGYEESLRAMQRGLLTEATRNIVGLEYGEDELRPMAAVLVVYGPESTVAVWDANLHQDEDLTAIQTMGVLTAGLAAVTSYLVEKENQVRDLEDECEGDREEEV